MYLTAFCSKNDRKIICQKCFPVETVVINVMCVKRREHLIKHPARDACLCMGDLQAPAVPAAPHFVFLITL